MRRPWVAVELRQRLSDARAARPVRGGGGHSRQRGVVVAAAELARHACETGAEDERLHAPARDHVGVEVLEQHARVRLHRSGDVADEHERPRLARRLAPAPLERLPAVAQGRPQRPAQVGRGGGTVGAPPPRRPQPPAAPHRPVQRQARDQAPRQLTLGLRVVGEVLVAQDLDVAPRSRQRPRVERSGLGRPRRRPARPPVAGRGRPPAGRSARARHAAASAAPERGDERRRRRRRSRSGASRVSRAARCTNRRGTTGRSRRAPGARRAARPPRRAPPLRAASRPAVQAGR